MKQMQNRFLKTIAKSYGLFYNSKMCKNKKICIFFVLLFTSISVYSKDMLKLEISTFAGIKHGEISKSIYLNDSSTKVSKLDWEEKNIYEFGIGTDITFFDLLMSMQFSVGLPLNCGNMYDSDWNLSGLKKTYTISECDLKQSFDSQIIIAYLAPSFSIFKLTPAIQIQYMYQNFNAHDGYGWYGAKEYAKIPRDYDVAWNDPLARKAKKIRDIDYYRHTILTLFGFDFYYMPIDKFTIRTGFFVSPFAYMYSLDTHHKSSANVHYCDVQFGYFSKYKATFKVEYKIKKRLKIISDISIIYGSTDYGDLYADEYSDILTKFENQPTSSSIFNIDFNIGTSFTIK